MKRNSPISGKPLFYSGCSMLGTFKPGDRLGCEMPPLEQLKKGDTIVFRGSIGGENDFVAHRVVGKGPAGLVTRGDNNPKIDENPLTELNFIGKVTCCDRKGRIHTVWNGRPGMMRARVLHGRLRAMRVAKFFFGRPYRALKRSGFVARFWQPRIETIFFQTPDGPLVKYVHQGRTVASCWTDANRWQVRRPYDFVIGPKFQS